MGGKILLASLLLCVTAAAVIASGDSDDWASFKQRHGKRFNSTGHEAQRRANFEARRASIARHNQAAQAGTHTYTMGLNEYSDLSAEELARMNGCKHKNDSSHGGSRMTFVESRASIPASIDWRSMGAVTPVKNQGGCGSCWAFSATGALEGQRFRATNQLVSLSEQQFLDCDTSDMACNGGWPGTAFQYVGQNKGLDTEAWYPYRGTNGSCKYSSTQIGATCSAGCVYVAAGNETALQQAVATIGPISLAIQVTGNFQSYRSGVFYDATCANGTALYQQINHGVLAVGYGTDKAAGDYWIVKNSWGTSWGEAGYIRMARNRGNNCGVALYGMYPSGVTYG